MDEAFLTLVMGVRDLQSFEGGLKRGYVLAICGILYVADAELWKKIFPSVHQQSANGVLIRSW